MKKIFSFILLIFSSGLAFPQIYPDSAEFEEGNGRGWQSVVLDFGFNFYDGSGLPELKTWGSRNVNLTLYRGMYIGSSKKFSLVSGIGLGMDNYNFQDESIRITNIADSFIVFQHTNGIDNEKSKLSVNYIDIPLELRFETGSRPYNTFRISLGGKIGFLFDAHSKAVYTPHADGETTKLKAKNLFGLETFRYGLLGRIGYGWLNFYGYYSLSDLFRDGRGPDATPYSIGISFSPSYAFKDTKRTKKRKVFSASLL